MKMQVCMILMSNIVRILTVENRGKKELVIALTICF